MRNLLNAVVLVGAVVAPALAMAEEITTTVSGHSMTYVATPKPPAVDLSHDEIIAIANQAKPSKPRVMIDPNAKVPTLK